MVAHGLNPASVGSRPTRITNGVLGWLGLLSRIYLREKLEAAQGAHSILVKVPYIFIVGFYLFFVCVCV